MWYGDKILFGKAIVKYIEEKNLSQEKLAELSDLHRTYISDVERGDRNISLINIEKICSALKIKLTLPRFYGHTEHMIK